MTYSEAEEYLLNIPRFTSKNEPEKTRAFLEEIGDFSTSIPTVHVAGTNGKGSVCAYLRSALSRNGLKVGMFTSPHLVSMRERFTVGSEMISEREFANVFSYIKSMVEEIRGREGFASYHPTFFEFLFFMAAVWFKEKKPDVIVLETGLGGRLDATNSIESPAVCVITEIGLDHMEYLGNTKEKIAGEKAGIIKPGKPVVHISRGESWDGVISGRAKELNCTDYVVSDKNIKNLETTGRGVEFSFQSLYDEFVKISLNTKALYQIENSALAFRTLEVLSNRIPGSLNIDKSVMGLFEMEWSGRMELLSCGVIVDGAHNEDGTKAFLSSVRALGESDNCLLYGAVSDKNIEAVASMIIKSGLFKKIFVTKLESYRSADIARLAAAFNNSGDCEVSYYNSVKDGMDALLSNDGASGRLYAAGSLYLVGEIKSLF